MGTKPAVKFGAGFTLVELLVVIAIIGILVALLLPAVQAAREAARRAQCSNNLKQIGLALQNHLSTKKVFPAGRYGCDGEVGTPCSGVATKDRVGPSGFVALLPFLEEQQLYDLFAIDVFVDGPWLTVAGSGTTAWIPRYVDALQSRPQVFVCPSDDPDLCCPTFGANIIVGKSHFLRPGDCAARGNYAFSLGTGGPPANGQMKFRNDGAFLYVYQYGSKQFTDGLSKTMFVGEAMDTTSPHNAIVWSLGYRLSTLRTTVNAVNTPPGEGITSDLYYPPAKQNGAFGSRHPGGAQFLFGDGRVTFVSDNIDRVSYNALATRAGADTDQGDY